MMKPGPSTTTKPWFAYNSKPLFLFLFVNFRHAKIIGAAVVSISIVLKVHGLLGVVNGVLLALNLHAVKTLVKNCCRIIVVDVHHASISNAVVSIS
jgi:hypothetical protein